MVDEGIKLIVSEPYDATTLRGPDCAELVKEREVSGIVANMLCERGVRIRAIREVDNSILTWFLVRSEFWISLIPKSNTVLVRCGGWPELWRIGYEFRATSQFQPVPYDGLLTAVRANLVSAIWDLEIFGTERDGCCFYLGFTEFDYGPEPVFVGTRTWIDSILSELNNEGLID